MAFIMNGIELHLFAQEGVRRTIKYLLLTEMSGQIKSLTVMIHH